MRRHLPVIDALSLIHESESLFIFNSLKYLSETYFRASRTFIYDKLTSNSLMYRIILTPRENK